MILESSSAVHSPFSISMYICAICLFLFTQLTFMLSCFRALLVHISYEFDIVGIFLLLISITFNSYITIIFTQLLPSSGLGSQSFFPKKYYILSSLTIRYRSLILTSMPLTVAVTPHYISKCRFSRVSVSV